MSFRRVLAVVGAVAVAAGLQTVPSYAAGTDVFVATAMLGGDDSNACTQAAPCATLRHALNLPDIAGGTIHVGPGTFDGGAQSTSSVTIVGAGSDQTVLTTTNPLARNVVAPFGLGVTMTVTDLTVQGSVGVVPVFVAGAAHLVAQRVVLEGGGCGLYVVTGGAATPSDASLSDSTVTNAPGDTGGCQASSFADGNGEIANMDGSVELTRTRVSDPVDGQPGVETQGGTTTTDQTFLDDSGSGGTTSHAFEVTGGKATVNRSVVSGFAVGADNAGGVLLVQDTTFEGNGTGVAGGSGATTVLRSTFHDGAVSSLQGTVSVAGSVLSAPTQGAVPNCTGAVDDLGYNLATDDSCAFSAPTSRDGVSDLNLDTTLADRGGPLLMGDVALPTVAIINTSSAVDSIPAGATYGTPAAPLCPATGVTDLRGVPRPVGGACDAGSMEMAATTTAVSAPKTARPHADVALVASIDVKDVGVEGLERPSGAVTFRAGSQVLCQDVLVNSGEARCTTDILPLGTSRVVAVFSPAAGSTLHASTSPARKIGVGTPAKVKGPHRVVVHVGKRATITLRGAGSPAPTFKVVRGKAPKGMRITRKAGRLIVSGTPRAAAVGQHSITLRVSNAARTITRHLHVVVRRA